jgi:hypothetical protein
MGFTDWFKPLMVGLVCTLLSSLIMGVCCYLGIVNSPWILVAMPILMVLGLVGAVSIFDFILEVFG